MSLERPKGFKCKDSMAAKGPVICSPQGQTRSRMKATSCHQVFSALQLRVSSSAPPSFGVTQTLEQARRHRGDGAGRTRPLLLSSASRAGPARELDSDVWGFYRNEVLPPRARSREHVPRPTSRQRGTRTQTPSTALSRLTALFMPAPKPCCSGCILKQSC